MAKKRPLSPDNLGSEEDLRIARELRKQNEAINYAFTGYVMKKREVRDLGIEINELEEAHKILSKEANKIDEETLDNIKDEITQRRIMYTERANEFNAISRSNIVFNKIVEASSALHVGTAALMLKYIMDAEKGFKMANLELGLSGVRSEILLDNLQDAAGYSARLGVPYPELIKAQTAFANETGRAVLLSGENLKNISTISKGLNISTEEAGRMAGKFESIGVSIDKLTSFYEETLNTSEEFGVSASNVISLINTHLERSQGYVFKDGVEGLRKMAQHATKFRVDMNGVFSAMDKARSLEGVVDMVSQLQVLGGNFARNNPFELLHLARTDGEAFTRVLIDMGRGLSTFNKNTGQFELQAGDLDRLRLMAQATGMDFNELHKQVRRTAEMDSISEQLLGSGLSKEAKEFIQGVAELQSDGSFKVKVASGDLRDIRLLSINQVEALRRSDITLQDRAKSAQTFNETIMNTVNEIKTMLLPFVEKLNSVVQWMNSNGGLVRGLVGGVIALTGAAAAGRVLAGGFRTFTSVFEFFTGKTINLTKTLSGLRNLFTGGRNTVPTNMMEGRVVPRRVPGQNIDARGTSNTLGNPLPQSSPNSPSNQRKITPRAIPTSGGTSRPISQPKPSSGGGLSKRIDNISKSAGAGYKNVLAFGGAILMVGGAIWLATKGIGSMVEQFQNLGGEQANQAAKTVLYLGGTLVGLSAGLLLVGTLGQSAVIPMLAFGGAVLMIGAGIGIAAAGLGSLASSFGAVGQSIAMTANPETVGSIAALTLSLGGLSAIGLLLANPLTWIGFKVLGNHIDNIGEKLNNSKFDSLASASTSFNHISNAIEKINETKLDKLIKLGENFSNINNLTKMVDSLTKIFGDGIDVKFKNDQVNLQVDVVAEMDSQKVSSKISKHIPLQLERVKRGSTNS